VQTKLGFDKFPVPSIISEVPLRDIVTGENLVDQSGLPLVTDAELVVSEIASASRATSVVAGPNNPAIPVVEQFPETSETSTTLLGINRAEVQLGLFSDVSVLGFDENNWETFSFGTGTSYGPWDSRATRDFGSHYGARMIEETGEQAIQLGAFPVPYSYPFGPEFENQGLYNQFSFQEYQNFITLGNFLFDHYTGYGVDSKGRPFNESFLDREKVRVSGNEVEFIGITEAQAFTLIDTWTRSWVDIQTNTLPDPNNPGKTISAALINNLVGSKPVFSNTRPGYSNTHTSYVYMQSRKAYRYQPGRISGYTFGAKASTDPSSNQNIIEWGIANPSDQYVFQIQGASFSIIRRSRVQLEPSVITSLGLDPIIDQPLLASGDPFDSNLYYTTKIPRELFNGDTLDGNGRSGYLLNPNNVTMYKIEFGWYGAIGAKFYVYIPVSNNEARWVLVHTLVIENQLGQPCLEDPYFRFKYSVDIQNNATLREPQFVYKYGASCFIDGGDEGTVVQRSYNSGQRTLISEPRAIIGLYPKTVITNNEGVSKANKKNIYPKSISVTSDSLAKIEVVKCKACPGFGHNYNHGLTATETGRVLNIEFVTLSKIRITTPNQYFTTDDIGSKIIGNGLWSGYIVEPLTSPAGSGLFEEATIERIVSTSYIKTKQPYPQTVFPQGAIEPLNIPLGSEYPYPIRLSKYDALAVSTTPLTGSKIEIQFMNPIARESLGHFAEFLLGVTNKKPIDSFDSGGAPVIRWQYGPTDERDELPLTDILFGEWLQSTTGRDRNGLEISESNYPGSYLGEIDYRIPSISGAAGGKCSKFTVEVLNSTAQSATMVYGNPATGSADGLYYIVLQPNAQFAAESILDGEVGLFDGSNFVSTGIVFETESLSYEDELDTIRYARISGQLPGVSPDDSIQFALTPIRITGTGIDKSKVISFNPFPLYLVCLMRDNAIVNSISVRESIGNTQISSTPRWLLNNNAVINNPAQNDLAPVNFVSESRLDGAALDTEVEQALRPFEVVDTFFIGANETRKIDLTNVFGADRESITPDLLNLEATFVVGQTIESSSGTIQLSLNTSEQ
jgi:hypothetical protein